MMHTTNRPSRAVQLVRAGPAIGTVLDPRFPQPGRYSEYGVPEAVRPAADTLCKELVRCPDPSPEAQIIESALLRLLGPWARD